MLDACYTGPRATAATWMVPFHLAEDALQHDQVVTHPVESGSRGAGAECQLIPRSDGSKEGGLCLAGDGRCSLYTSFDDTDCREIGCATFRRMTEANNPQGCLVRRRQAMPFTHMRWRFRL